MKTKGKCVGCKSIKLVNPLGLCKRCNRHAHDFISEDEMARIKLEREALLAATKAIKKAKKEAAAEKEAAKEAEAEEGVEGEEGAAEEEGEGEEGGEKEEAEGGDEGGYIVAEGTPEDIVSCAESSTGQYLKELLENEGKNHS